jgi:hypothetical protein
MATLMSGMTRRHRRIHERLSCPAWVAVPFAERRDNVHKCIYHVNTFLASCARVVASEASNPPPQN